MVSYGRPEFLYIFVLPVASQAYPAGYFSRWYLKCDDNEAAVLQHMFYLNKGMTRMKYISFHFGSVTLEFSAFCVLSFRRLPPDDL